MFQTTLNTVFPIILLIILGYFSRQIKIFKAGDEKPFSSYVFFFALPALFFINMAELEFSRPVIKLMLAGAAPVFFMSAIFITAYFLLRLKKDLVYLLIFCSAFGSHAFFGIPFIMFAFPGQEGESLAALSAASIAIVSVIITMLVLELHSIGRSDFWTAAKQLTSKLSRNPLILSVILGMVYSLLGLKLPLFLSSALHMIGQTTAPVSLFMLGIFIFGRKYENLGQAAALSLLRIVMMPLLGIAAVMLFNISGTGSQVLIMMHAMPVAVSMIVLSERYNFHKDTIASLTLISSIGSLVYLPVWLYIVGVR